MQSVDLAFHLTGNAVPADHGYALYSALSHVLPAIHPKPPVPGDHWANLLAVHPIRGRLIGERQLALVPGTSRLTVRIRTDHIREFLPLVGKVLRIDGSAFTIGVPTTHALVPATTLRSRLVVVKGFLDPEPFLDAIARQLAALEISANPTLQTRNSERPMEGRSMRETEINAPLRRTLRIRDKEVVGYGVQVSGLSPEDSLRLQETGLGGRRRFGCGVFVPRTEAGVVR